ncbi:efflux RND transporter periplasmic adaptor subunit [Desulforhopalus singaporensis]|uniref:RND family efflux transporter, MFP subunit n=1 Tax=Desulforhopalus singaporensis TaxID=91360 RepID=A0A1H0IX64_9BACT|nr:HlyD family efflux transporter periplasmic adaptor subunit [Desulforhopalus singaporensis]SDO36104.1 hypothetical protein SAMN05660330_00063 [Desulforhopalus singaporensis]
MNGNSFFRRKTVVFIPLVAAVLVVALLVVSRSGPPRKEVGETVQAVRVITVAKTGFVPRTSGYGIVEPGRVWRAVAEVRGPVKMIHPELKAGAMLFSGDVLLTIEPAQYEYAVAAAVAALSEVEAGLDELSVQKENTRLSLNIEQRSLELAEQSLKRKKNALDKNTLTPYEVDLEERNVLQQRQRVQDLKNTLRLIPSRQKNLEAKKASQKAKLEQAELELAKTVIRAPFDCRIGSVAIEPFQVLGVGQMLFEAHGTDVAEIEVQVAPERLRHLIGMQDESGSQTLGYPAAMDRLSRLAAAVRITSGDWQAQWRARVDRLRETIDPATRDFRLVVAVDEPYRKVIPGKRPPLTRGQFCEVELQGAARPDSIVIPRSALHGDRVFVVDGDSRLQPVSVQPLVVLSDLAVIASGLGGGETLVVSDPAPAVTGMRLVPVVDEQLQQRIVAQAENTWRDP